MSEIRILGVHISNRIEEAGMIQKVLMEYGCSVKTRLGLHEVTDKSCSTVGIVILELTGPVAEQDKLEKALTEIEGVDVQKMVF